MSEKKKGWVPKGFKDSVIGEYFEGGKFHDNFEPGAFANYIAAKKVLLEKPKDITKSDAKASAATTPSA